MASFACVVVWFVGWLLSTSYAKAPYAEACREISESHFCVGKNLGFPKHLVVVKSSVVRTHFSIVIPDLGKSWTIIIEFLVAQIGAGTAQNGLRKALKLLLSQIIVSRTPMPNQFGAARY